MTDKLCPRCGVTKPLTDYPKDRRRPSGHFPYCKACNTKHARKWAVENKDKVAAYMQEYREANAQALRDARSKWQRNNPEYGRNVVRTRRAKKRGNTIAPPTIEDINARVAACGGKCVYCGEAFTQIDHVIAIAEGGTDDIYNLVPACRRCNFSKGTKDWREWFSMQHFFSPAIARRIERLITPP